jgi:hypothetical protein
MCQACKLNQAEKDVVDEAQRQIEELLTVIGEELADVVLDRIWKSRFRKPTPMVET